MFVKGIARAPRGQERCPQLISVTEVMGEAIDARTKVQPFETLVPLRMLDERLFMERTDQPHDLSLRIFDLVAPIGKGQRGLIVAQPKCGKTVYLQKIANSITHNNPVKLIVLLIDERPEEVTDMQRSVNGEVISSTFDQRASRHVQAAEMAINKAKRLVETGKDVVILLDSITVWPGPIIPKHLQAVASCRVVLNQAHSLNQNNSSVRRAISKTAVA